MLSGHQPRISAEVCVRVPSEVWELLAKFGVAVVQISEITARPSLALKNTYRVTLADGRVVKVRRLQSVARAEQVERLLKALGPNPAWAGLLLRFREFFLEEWVEGESLGGQPPEPAVARQCGVILAQLHQVAIPADEAIGLSVEQELGQVRSHLGELEAAGRFTRTEAIELADRAVALAPRRIQPGIVHLDFCGENLVWHPIRGPVCVDNETLRIGSCEQDLGRAVHRWNLEGVARAEFLAGYAAAEGPAGLDALPFWGLAAEAYSASIRLRYRFADAGAPIQALKRRLEP